MNSSYDKAENQFFFKFSSISLQVQVFLTHFLTCLFLEVLRRIISTEIRFLFFKTMSLVLLCISRWASLTECKTQRILQRILSTVCGQLCKGKSKPQKSYYTTNMATLLNGFQLGSLVCPAEYGGTYTVKDLLIYTFQAHKQAKNCIAHWSESLFIFLLMWTNLKRLLPSLACWIKSGLLCFPQA